MLGAWVFLFPDHGRKEVLGGDFNVGGNYAGRPPAEQNVLSGGLEKVVVKLNGGDRVVAAAATHSCRIGAFSGARYAIQAANVRVDDGNRLRAVDDSNAVTYFTAVGGVDPVAIEDDVVCVFCGGDSADVRVRGCSPLNANEADVIPHGRSLRTARHQGGEQRGWSTGRLVAQGGGRGGR